MYVNYHIFFFTNSFFVKTKKYYKHELLILGNAIWLAIKWHSSKFFMLWLLMIQTPHLML